MPFLGHLWPRFTSEHLLKALKIDENRLILHTSEAETKKQLLFRLQERHPLRGLGHPGHQLDSGTLRTDMTEDGMQKS